MAMGMFHRDLPVRVGGRRGEGDVMAILLAWLGSNPSCWIVGTSWLRMEMRRG